MNCFRRQGEAEADEEGEENNHMRGDLPWDEDEVEWEEGVVDATALEVFLQSPLLGRIPSYFHERAN